MKHPVLNIFRESLDSLWRNRLLTSATVLAIAIIFVLLNLLLVVAGTARSAVSGLQEELRITVYLSEGISLAQTESLIAELNKKENVKPPVIYTSSEQAKQFLMENFPETEDFFLTYDRSLPANITITPRSNEAVIEIQKFLDQSKFQDVLHPISSTQNKRQQKNFDDVLRNLDSVNTFINEIILWLTIAFILGGLLLIQNAIHMSIHARREEIGIMKLVGASLHKIRAPLILEGIWYGIISFLVSVLLFFLIISAMSTAKEFIAVQTLLNVFLIELIVAVLIGASASMLAARRYIKHRNPFRL